MSKLIRHYMPGQSIFITSVTCDRKPILTHYTKFLTQAVQKAKRQYNFNIIAWVILPDHFHLILNAPNGSVSSIMHCLKLSFSGRYRFLTGGKGLVWQRRYWDHIIRSEDDMNRHIDYIHYNPVKHRLVNSPIDYKLSSFKKYCKQGQYDLSWRADPDGFGDFEFGE